MEIQQAVEVIKNNPELAKQADTQMRELLVRSATDLDFRAQLLSNPRAAMSQFFGKPMSDSFDIAFIENKADATVVLPDPVDLEGQISDSDLEAVAGGVTPTVLISWASVLGVIASAEWVTAEIINASK